VDRAEGSSGALIRDALTPVLPEWLEGVRGGLTFRVTQLLTGHGSFGDYLYRIGRVVSPACPHCEQAGDSTGHTLGECPEWADDRERLMAGIGRDLRLATVLRAAASSSKKWDALVFFTERVIMAKEIAERARQAAENAPRWLN